MTISTIKTTTPPIILKLHVLSTLRNTLITLVDWSKNTNQIIFQTTSRRYPLSTKHKNNAFVLQKISSQLIKLILKLKSNTKSNLIVQVFIQGIGSGRYPIINELINQKQIKINQIIDKTPIPFNGCRAKKKKRR